MPPHRTAGAFHFYYEDSDIGEGMKLVGFYDAAMDAIVTKHAGLPSSEQFEEAAAKMDGSGGEDTRRREASAATWNQRAALGLGTR